jgi:hypothetical protein
VEENSDFVSHDADTFLLVAVVGSEPTPPESRRLVFDENTVSRLIEAWMITTIIPAIYPVG